MATPGEVDKSQCSERTQLPLIVTNKALLFGQHACKKNRYSEIGSLEEPKVLK